MPTQVSITKKPLLPILKIQKNDGTFYTFNHFTHTYDFRIRKARIVPASDGLGGYFQITIAHTNPSTLASMVGNISRGNEVRLWIGKTDVSGTQNPRFLGVVELLTDVEPTYKWYELTITGVDYGTHILQHRIGNAYYEQRKLSDGVTADKTDTSTNIANIIYDLLTNNNQYLLPGVSVATQGITVAKANIVDTGRSLDNFKVDAVPLEDALQTLDDEDGTIHYIDPTKTFYRVFPQATQSGILLTDDYKDTVALGWDQTKVGLILPSTQLDVNSQDRVAILMGLGGDEIAIDQQQTDITQSDINLRTTYYAMKFRPNFRDCTKFQVAVGKVGNPSGTLEIELVEADNNGLPLGTEIRDVTLDLAEISSTADITADPLKAWRTFTVGQEKLNTAKDHFIICFKTGGDASNYVVWYRSNTAGASGASMHSSNLTTWTATDTNQFAFRTYYTTPVLGVLVQPGGVQSNDKYYREYVIKKPSITDFNEMYNLLNAQKQFYFNDRYTFRAKIYAPDAILDNGMKVRIRKQQTVRKWDYNDFVTSGTEWVFEQSIGTFIYECNFTRFA